MATTARTLSRNVRRGTRNSNANRGATRLGAALVALCLAAGEASATVSFFDGVFAPVDWTHSIVTNANGSSSTANAYQVLAGGNPNEFRRIDLSLVASAPGGAVLSLSLNNNAFYNPGSQGAITFIDYSEDSINFIPNSGDGQGSGLMIVQSGTTYIQRNPVLVMPYTTFSSWTPNPAPGLVASDLWELTGSGTLISTSNPDFSAAGGLMQLGFWRGSSSGSSTGTFDRQAGIDNWNVRIVPTPSTMALLGTAGLIGARRRRTAR